MAFHWSFENRVERWRCRIAMVPLRKSCPTEAISDPYFAGSDEIQHSREAVRIGQTLIVVGLRVGHNPNTTRATRRGRSESTLFDRELPVTRDRDDIPSWRGAGGTERAPESASLRALAYDLHPGASGVRVHRLPA